MDDFEYQLQKRGGWANFQRRIADLEKSGTGKASAYIIAMREEQRRWNEKREEERAEPVPQQEVVQEQLGFLNDVEWVYMNIELEEHQRSSPPSPGALWLMRRAREDGKFLMNPLMMVAKKAEIDKTEMEIRKDCRRTAADIDKTLSKIAEKVNP